MNTPEILGAVAAQYLCDHLAEDDTEGTARYLLDCLTAEQTAAVAQTIIADKDLNSLIEIKLPRHFIEELEDHGLPEEALTNERTTYFRNAACTKSAILLANVGDDEQQGLTELVPIGAPQLLSHPELWVAVASRGLSMTDEHSKWWIKALQGLPEAHSISLERFADYLSATRAAISNEGQPIRNALGYALPALHLPRDTNYFEALNVKTSGHKAKWKNLYSSAFKKRGCYLVKQTPTQSLIDEETLENSFEKVQDSIPSELHSTVKDFIKAPNGWNSEAAALADCEWELVCPLFDGLKRERFNLGKATYQFYEEWDLGLLSEEDIDYLQRLEKRKTTQPEEEDELFYQAHRNELKDKASLKAKWDRFIFGSPLETEDFISGIAQCLQSLFDQNEQSVSRKLTIESDKRTPRDLKQLNRDAGLYFAFRYNGFKELLGRSVRWELGNLMKFPQEDLKWRKATKPYQNRSKAKAAMQIKFFLILEAEQSNGTLESFTKQLIWKFNPNAISSELHEDWSRLKDNPLLRCEAYREQVSGKGRFQSIDLRNAQTLQATYDKDRGSLVAVYHGSSDLSKIWPDNLKEAVNQQCVDPEVATELSKLFDEFLEKYRAAVVEFWENGLASPSLLTEQLTSFSNLLELLCRKAKGDRNRDLLLRPLLEVGAVPVQGGPVASVVAPWHPLRLAAMANKALHVRGLIKHLTTAENVYFGDTKLYFEELKNELDHPFYPEVILGWDETKPLLLSLADHYLDYSLHEPPVVNQEHYADTNENPAESANRVIDILKRYLALYPHEQANLSVVLFNCDSARLPHAIVDKVQELHEDDGDMRCQVVLRHRDGNKLRQLYERIIERTDADNDSFVASEASRDFMARLRIGIMADEAPPPDDADGPPTDVVFLQDVIARHAELEWYEEDANPISFEEWIPSRWSRRCPVPKDDKKSIVYLCSPAASREGWNFLTAITTFLKSDWDGKEDKRLLPARQLNFNDPQTASIFSEVHRLGNWVVNYDELLDRRQLANQQVKIIRYKQSDTQGRNMLISSTSKTTLLHRMIVKRLEALTLGISSEEISDLAQRFINEANKISGDLVLRAAKRGKNASELIGVVLSKYLIEKELPEPNRYFGWYFLDDYADWLGQREEHIADILALSPEVADDGSHRLAVVISEAKYVEFPGLAAKRKDSQKQLRQTVDRISKALFGDPGRLDRDIWLSRFSDLVLNGIEFPATSNLNLSEWRREIRDGKCPIYLRGYSHVFVSGPSDSPECSDFAQVAECDGSYQEVYSRAKLRELILHYFQTTDPTPVRVDIADKDIWKEKEYQCPSDRIKTLVETPKKPKPKPEPETPKDEDSPDNGQPAPDPDPTPPGPTPEPSSLPKDPPQIMQTDPQTEEEQAWLKEVSSQTKGALQQFQLKSKLISATLTPNAALLKFEGSSNLTVDQVLRKRSEFLTTHKLNLISVRAEPGLVVLSVARPDRQVLTLNQAWASWNPDTENGNTELPLGIKEDDGTLLLFSPQTHAPHSLIAGSTGSGKSVLMQNLILAIARTNSTEQAQILLIDPKHGVDYFDFENLPHLQQGIITEQDNSTLALNALVGEMDRRYQLLRENKVKNIFQLYQKEDATEKPPVLWVIHDEFAEWMLTDSYKDSIEDIVSRLGVKARAAGIFLIFAAQRPDAKVMPMHLRANLGNRFILKVDSEGTSEISLGEKGAERLLGKGHMCAKLEGEADLIFAQVPLITDSDIHQPT